MSKGTYTGAARRPALEAGKTENGMRRVIIGKETGNDLNNPLSLIHNYVDPEGEFKGEIVKENVKNFVVEYPEATFKAIEKRDHDTALRRVGQASAGIGNELGSKVVEQRTTLTNKDVSEMISSDNG